MTDPVTNTSLAADRRDARRPYTCRGRARLSSRSANLFRSYIADQQASAGIPLNQRVLLQVVSTKAATGGGTKEDAGDRRVSGSHSSPPSASRSFSRTSGRVFRPSSRHGGAARRACGRRQTALVMPRARNAPLLGRIAPPVRGDLRRGRPRRTLRQCPQRARGRRSRAVAGPRRRRRASLARQSSAGTA